MHGSTHEGLLLHYLTLHYMCIRPRLGSAIYLPVSYQTASECNGYLEQVSYIFYLMMTLECIGVVRHKPHLPPPSGWKLTLSARLQLGAVGKSNAARLLVNGFKNSSIHREGGNTWRAVPMGGGVVVGMAHS
ncbi:hypothetical protein K440DRAFT_219874 [Wilcoxina mikolae CBS 423.85]|nr:hypothetical protein K440DRAFT_219874 [Wilcoxina mikolae CBS 423.85]